MIFETHMISADEILLWNRPHFIRFWSFKFMFYRVVHFVVLTSRQCYLYGLTQELPLLVN